MWRCPMASCALERTAGPGDGTTCNVEAGTSELCGRACTIAPSVEAGASDDDALPGKDRLVDGTAPGIVKMRVAMLKVGPERSSYYEP